MVAMDWTEKKTFHVPSVGVGLQSSRRDASSELADPRKSYWCYKWRRGDTLNPE